MKNWKSLWQPTEQQPEAMLKEIGKTKQIRHMSIKLLVMKPSVSHLGSVEDQILILIKSEHIFKCVLKHFLIPLEKCS